MRGRKPKPTAVQIAEGDPRKLGKHKLEEKLANEPKAQRGLPSCPRHLRGRARYAWTFWSRELQIMELDRRPDAMMLEGACVNYGRAVQADLILQREGLTVQETVATVRSERKRKKSKAIGFLGDDTPDPRISDESCEVVTVKIKAHPAVAVSNAAWRQVRAFCSEFGLSPVSRTRLPQTPKDAATDDLFKLLAQPRAAKPTVTVQ